MYLKAEKTIIKYKPFIYFEFAPYLYEFGYSSEILIKFIKKDLNYVFYDENLKRFQISVILLKNFKISLKTFFVS